MTAAALRCRRFRARQAEGKIVLQIECDEINLTEALIVAGLLAPGIDHDRDAIARATEALLAALAAESSDTR